MRTQYHIIIDKKDLEEFNRVVKLFGIEYKLLKNNNPAAAAISIALSKYEYLFVHISIKCVIQEAEIFS